MHFQLLYLVPEAPAVKQNHHETQSHLNQSRLFETCAPTCYLCNSGVHEGEHKSRCSVQPNAHAMKWPLRASVNS